MKKFLLLSNTQKTVLILFLCLILAAVIALLIFLYKPQYSGKWNGEFSEKDVVSIVKKGEDLKILQLTDLHVDHTNTQHEKIWNNLEKLVNENDTDLTVITGDWVSSKDNYEKTQKLISVMDGCKKPWAVVFGNHDSEGKASREELGQLFKSSEYCLYLSGPDDLSGEGNYIINVYNHSNPNHLDASLILMDSQSSPLGTPFYEPLYRDQVKWYDESVKGLNKIYTSQNENKAEIIPSLLFLHVPLTEYNKISEDNIISGKNNEKICSPVCNTGIFKKITENGSTKGVFCGHDHTNSAAIKHNGVILSYGVQTGLCETDSDFAQTLKKGGNLITLKDNGAITVERVYHEEQYEIK